MTIAEMARSVYLTAKTKGWWDGGEGTSVGTKIALMHSELSEALEEFRKTPDRLEMYFEGESDKPEGFVVELADCVIRIMDLCEHLGLDLEQALELKAEYNKTRPYKHGGKAV